MKKIIILILTAFIFSALLSSCEKWFDVDASTRITQEKLFESPSGFRSAVNGVYRLLGEKELYGRELTWGIVSVLGHNYDYNTLPYYYRNLIDGYLDYANVRAIIDPVWEKGFRVIANCNNIIAHTEKQDASFFVMGENEKDLILGEMHGVRALMHFQLLQLFAPAPAQDDGRPYMPYVDKYPEHQPKHLKVSQILDKAIIDMEYAATTLAVNDTLFNERGMSSMGVRIESENTLVKGGLFFGYRATRMNYVAAKALLARMYLWKGDKENALRCAKDAYRFFRYRDGMPGVNGPDKNWFSYTSLSTSTVNDIYRKMPDDILFAAYNRQEYEIYVDATKDNYIMAYKNVSETFSNTETNSLEPGDWRYSRLIESNNSSRRWIKPIATNQYDYTAIRVINTQVPLLPVIRMSEVAHIICECDQTIGQGAIYVLRYYRGIQGGGEGQVSTAPENYWKAVINDVVRENMSEGRTFFFFKRLNLPVYNGSNDAVDMSSFFKIELPYSETAYSNL